MVAIAIVALVGMVSLTVDGAFLFLKHRAMRNANDAASLAAALSCAMFEGQGTADAQADLLATENVTAAIRATDPTYDPSCDAPEGTVTVTYEAPQQLFFSQVVGVDSPKVVRASATAIWGGAGAADQVLPLMLSMNRLSTCGIPGSVAEGDRCLFWWDNGSRNDQSALTNSEWGLIDLGAWNVSPDASCPGNVSQAEVTQWVTSGFSETLFLVDPPPTYVCRGNGFQGNALNNDINSVAGQIVPMPVNDPMQQVRSNGSLCRPGGLDGTCSVHKYAIVGFAMLEIVQVWTGTEARARCGQPGSGNGNGNGSARCLETIWRGYQTGGLKGGGGENFGLIAISLTE
jgi:hypothetical protein